MSDIMIICPPRKERNVDFNPQRGRNAKNPEPRHVRPFAALSTQGPYLYADTPTRWMTSFYAY